MSPTKHKLTTLNQMCQLIPPRLVPTLAAKHKVDARKFSPWSHVTSLLYGQLSHALSLNDICDGLSNHASRLGEIRKAQPPKKNTFSNANRTRPPEMAEELFWTTLGHLQDIAPGFGLGRRYVGLPRKFKRAISAIDATTIQLVANSMDWAKHRRRKAAAKMHLNLNLQTFLPQVVVVDSAKVHDNTRARELCACLLPGEIALFDKAYIDFEHLYDLTERGVFWVTRAKKNMGFDTIEERELPARSPADICLISDTIIELNVAKSHDAYPSRLRRVEADVEVKGEMKRMVFITNNMKWSATSICQLYKARWGIETFFKEIKQTLQLSDFLGHNENAVRWQLWIALLAYILLRFTQHIHRWTGSFRRLYTLLRGVLWDRYEVAALLDSYGTASDPPRLRSTPSQVYLPGFKAFSMGQHDGKISQADAAVFRHGHFLKSKT